MAYTEHTWVDDEVITKEKMNNLESGVKAANEGIPSNATTSKSGIIKQSAAVPEATGEQVTKEEFKALLDALKTAGIMASS